MIVVDTSVALQWILPEDDALAAQEFAGRTDVHAPDVLLVEVANVLGKSARGGRMTVDQAVRGLELVRENVRLEPTAPLLASALELSVRIVHPVYDCVFLACAITYGSVVIRRDRKFVERAARGYEANVRLLPKGESKL